MHSALGDPVSSPLGCPTLLQGCAEVLIRKFDSSLAARYPDLAQKLMGFLTLPRSWEEIKFYASPHALPCRRHDGLLL
jgi:hypothetical protein